MVDKAKLDQMVSNLGQYIATLRSLGKVPQEEFLSNSDRVGNAKYHFVIAIECCVDIANHIISSEGYRLPKTNADSLQILVEEAIMPGELLESLISMARFRNRLVHLYWAIDDQRIYEFLQTSLSVMEIYMKAVQEHSW